MELTNDLQDILDVMKEMLEDETIPKSVREKLEKCVGILNSEEETKLAITKVLDELEEVNENINLEPYTRTQIWDLVTNLESISNSLD